MVKLAQTDVEKELLEEISSFRLNPAKVKALFDRHPDLDPDLCFSWGQTILSRVIECCHSEDELESALQIFRFLLEKGADPNGYLDKSYQAPIWRAADCFSPAFLKLLLEHPKIDPNADFGDKGMNTPLLRVAGFKGNSQWENALKAKGIWDQRCENEKEKFRLIYQHPRTKKNVTTREGKTVLEVAVLAGNYSIAEFIVKDEAQSPTPELLLHTAVKSLQLEMVKYVLSLPGVDVNAVDEKGFTALELAAAKAHDRNAQTEQSKKSWEIARFLAEHPSVNPNIVSPHARNIMQRAARRGDLNLVKLLLKKGMHPDLAGSDKEDLMEWDQRVPPICCAVNGLYWRRVMPPCDRELHKGERQHKVIRVLLEAGAKINATDGDNQSILLYSIHREQGIIPWLLSKGADPNILRTQHNGYGGETPLMSMIDHFRFMQPKAFKTLYQHPRTNLFLRQGGDGLTLLQYVDWVKDRLHEGIYACWDKEQFDHFDKRIDEIREELKVEIAKRQLQMLCESNEISIRPSRKNPQEFMLSFSNINPASLTEAGLQTSNKKYTRKRRREEKSDVEVAAELFGYVFGDKISLSGNGKHPSFFLIRCRGDEAKNWLDRMVEIKKPPAQTIDL